HLRCAREYVCAVLEQAFNDRKLALVYCVVQLGHRHRRQECRVVHPAQFSVQLLQVFVAFGTGICYIVVAYLWNALSRICANRCRRGSVFFYHLLSKQRHHLPCACLSRLSACPSAPASASRSAASGSPRN